MKGKDGKAYTDVELCTGVCLDDLEGNLSKRQARSICGACMNKEASYVLFLREGDTPLPGGRTGSSCYVCLHTGRASGRDKIKIGVRPVLIGIDDIRSRRCRVDETRGVELCPNRSLTVESRSGGRRFGEVRLNRACKVKFRRGCR